VNYYVEFDLPRNQVEKVNTGDGRDVHRVPNRDLKLNPQMNPRFGKTGEKK